MIASKRTVKNDIGEHCRLLITDFFNFFEGRADEVKLIDIRDIKEQMPPDREQVRKMMARCDKAWKLYCDYAGLPMASKKLFINRIRNEWQTKAQMELDSRHERTLNVGS